MAWLERLKARARRMKTEVFALALAARHPQTPWYAKLILAGVVLYALTPVDLVPDFIPVVGLIDDLVFIWLAVALAIRFVPPPVLAECRERAQAVVLSPRQRRLATLIAIAVWATVLVVAGVLLYQAA
jgi:uncharacterized membrane protein YkvA (DUF1232 family)